jgi:hypothetical protein
LVDDGKVALMVRNIDDADVVGEVIQGGLRMRCGRAAMSISDGDARPVGPVMSCV